MFDASVKAHKTSIEDLKPKAWKTIKKQKKHHAFISKEKETQDTRKN